jgi:Ras-related protein Rab-1A
MTSEASHFKVVLVGSSLVGKTSLFERFKGNPLPSRFMTTVGGGCAVVPVVLGGDTVSLTIWDTAGQETYRSIIPFYFAHAHVIVVVYDITNIESFEGIAEWAQIARGHAPAEVKLILVGNKSDLEDERNVSRGAAEERRIELMAENASETSALTGDGVAELLGVIAENVTGTQVAAQGEQNEVTLDPTLPKEETTKSCKC